MSLLTFIFFYVLVFVQAVPLVKRIVVSPQITSPTASTTWNVGDKVTVTWCVQLSQPYLTPRAAGELALYVRVYRDTSRIPPPGNFTGQLLLGFLTHEGENLDIGELTVF